MLSASCTSPLVSVVVSGARHLQGPLLVGRYGTSRRDDVTAGKELLVCEVGVRPFSKRNLLRQIRRQMQPRRKLTMIGLVAFDNIGDGVAR